MMTMFLLTLCLLCSATVRGLDCLPNPGGAAEEVTLQVQQTWAQEPAGYTRSALQQPGGDSECIECRTAKVAIPATASGQKVPVVFHLHGEHVSRFQLKVGLIDSQVTEGKVILDHLGASSETTVSLWLLMDMRGVGETQLQLSTFHLSIGRNVYSEKSKADDVQFILDLIAKIGQEIPAADMNNVNIAGGNTEKKMKLID